MCLQYNDPAGLAFDKSTALMRILQKESLLVQNDFLFIYVMT